MMDHNPGPIPTIFRFTLDVAMFLAADVENIVAVHCKAGKGRSGLAICSYLILIEAVDTADNAIKLFNSR
jgi:phosphatidylinositol-3,4,5-trisphosphate 3-phosphatase/dual-specificity protein phosphatase PTEN